ncbi:MAG: murein biosynthesis integral membrane protein MurJ [Candidatus Andersenbacteria bacterium RIFCSPHIGHO2_02_FULL_45_11]|uniref:Probable lipid II flippase MurJ n=1 Tax=Candidatus Andersenbacteria bacterium RIFCSPHIGHO2_12_FULL_45_11 TaxID=1797281 RepID=A0A1G1X4E5_9BACT|nr:MAG: murein biosynthesis integral membrane protein MurJ [Candidatus Andersenbacteria bacterium RIFCSPHIGHO2_01_FULL_46_36]OGY32244.1 MAG: murein biosynthesis integral membrane protein MurJ [Candidatus Andersenbacteria bacterium RIFCSPHIGHO2_02_FULL_45_11]OGY34197.1 MAG: murein biosynthesis integral membrane protein MurJ [Candidatus Andersenbacteria bacterium RIFCSPHIGHO2_12_FULL_45_11]
MSTSEFRHTASNAGMIGAAALAGSVVGFVLQLLVAYYFGAGNQTDAFFMAQSTSEMLAKLLLGGSVTAVFIPLFVERLAVKNRDGAWRLAFNILNIMTVAYIALLGCIWLLAGPFVHFIAPGFNGDTYTLTVSLLRLLLPSFLFLFLVEFATSILHSFKLFTLPATLRIVAPLVSILSILVFVHTLGIHALAIGIVAGSIIQLAILVVGLRRQGMKYRFFIDIRDPAIRSLVRLVYPFIFSLLMTQGAGIVYRILVSGLEEGSLSALKFAEKITQLLTIVFLNSVTLVIYPLLSEKASLHDTAGMRSTIASAMRLVVFVSLPLILAVAILREPLVTFLYQRGSFTASDTAATSIALLYLVLGLTTTGISSILGHAVLAIQKTRAAVAITIISQVVAISLFYFLVPTMGMAGLALASSLVPLSSALLYFLYLRRHIPALSTIFAHTTYIKTIILAIVSSAIVWVVSLSLTNYVLLQIIASLLAGALCYLVAARAWHIEEMQEVLGMVRAKLTRRAV